MVLVRGPKSHENPLSMTSCKTSGFTHLHYAFKHGFPLPLRPPGFTPSLILPGQTHLVNKHPSYHVVHIDLSVQLQIMSIGFAWDYEKWHTVWFGTSDHTIAPTSLTVIVSLCNFRNMTRSETTSDGAIFDTRTNLYGEYELWRHNCPWVTPPNVIVTFNCVLGVSRVYRWGWGLPRGPAVFSPSCFRVYLHLPYEPMTHFSIWVGWEKKRTVGTNCCFLLTRPA